MGIPAAATGALLATFPGSLLSATSTPLWASGYRLLPALFGLSGTSTALAAITLLAGSRKPLERLAAGVSLAELFLSLRLDVLWKAERISEPMEQFAVPYQAGALGLGVVAPLLVHGAQVVTGRELRSASTLAAVAALVGGFMQRAVFILAGKRSAERPGDYFRIAQ
jgi:formate-dependent nitrite reductase membrane component NrfD